LNFNSGTHTDSAPVHTPSLIISINNQYEYEHLIVYELQVILNDNIIFNRNITRTN